MGLLGGFECGRTVLVGRMRIKAAITLKKGRAALAGVCVESRELDGTSRRRLAPVDNFSIALSSTRNVHIPSISSNAFLVLGPSIFLPQRKHWHSCSESHGS